MGWKEALERSELSVDERNLFLSFANDAYKRDVKDVRIRKYLSILSIARKMSGKDLFGITRNIKSLGDFCVLVNTEKLHQPETKRSLKLIVGALFCFIHYKERSLKYAPAEVKRMLEHRFKAADKRLARPILTRDNIRELTQCAKSTQDKALLWVIFESGMRIGELIQLKRSDFTQFEEGYSVRVPGGKTGERMSMINEGANYVSAWLAEHPISGKDAPFWYAPNRSVLTGAGLSRRICMVRDALNAKRKKKGVLQLERDVNPHNFRHSRASELGGEPGMTEAILCRYFGWEIGSDMPRTYLHLTDAQVKKAILATYGRAKPEEKKPIETSWTCTRCKEEVPLAQNFCGRCGTSQEGKVISLTTKLQQQIAGMTEKAAKQDARSERMEKQLATLLKKKLKG